MAGGRLVSKWRSPVINLILRCICRIRLILDRLVYVKAHNNAAQSELFKSDLSGMSVFLII